MFNLKSVVLALSLAAISFSASAKDYAAVEVTPGQFTFENTAPDASFEDWVSFNVGASGDFLSTISGTSSNNFSFSAFDLYDSSKTLVKTGSFNNINGTASIGFLDNPATTGTYYLFVAGSTVGGTYNGNISISAVPEPETYAMLLSGLGLMGFAARRKRG